MPKFRFGELELAIIRIVRDLKTATVRDVQKRLSDDRSYTTIMTVMSRLAKKKELARYKQGKEYIYQVEEKKLSSYSFLHRVLHKIFGGSSCAMVGYLLDNSKEISKEELEAMEKLIREKRKKL